MTNCIKEGLHAYRLSATDKQMAQLEEFSRRMLETNKVMNLTAITDPIEIAQRHFLDCAALLTAADFSGKTVIDVGCGAGFPGIPLGILCPKCYVTLLDALNKRIRFLQSCMDEMALRNFQAVHARAEEYAVAHRESYDFAVSRAVAQLNVLAELSIPFVKVGGFFIAMKSVDTQEEIDKARRGIGQLGGHIEEIRDYTIPGTDITHRLVFIRKVKPTPAAYPRKFHRISSKPL